MRVPGTVTASQPTADTGQAERRRRPRGAVRDGLIAAGLELARAGGPDGVVLREATRMVGVVPNAAYRHFADRDELLAAVCAAAMGELGDRMAADVARVPGRHGDPAVARGRLSAIGLAYLRFAREEPGLFATAFALPQQHAYGAPEYAASDEAAGPDRTPQWMLSTKLAPRRTGPAGRRAARGARWRKRGAGSARRPAPSRSWASPRSRRG